MRPVFIIAAALVAGAWVVSRNQPGQESDAEGASDEGEPGVFSGGVDNVLSDAMESTAEAIDSFTGGFLKISAMAQVTPDMLNNRNVQAILRVIRTGEGTNDEAGYRKIFGGQLFTSYADHPRITVKSSGYTSSAAGAYQILASTWDETKRIMSLPDFSPRSQDLAAVGRIKARGALDDVLTGKLDAALKKISREWASLPYSPYGQPTISLNRARELFASNGGQDTGTALA